MTAPGAAPPKVWVLDDPRAGTASQALGIAERLGVPFRRIRLSWNWKAHVAALAWRGSLIGLASPGSTDEGQSQSQSQSQSQAQSWSAAALMAQPAVPPSVVISSGSRSAAVALWLKARLGCGIVHCMRPGLGGMLRARAYDLLVIPEHDQPPVADNVIPVLGAPHRVSGPVLRQARAQWRERLDHLPHPRIALLVGGPREHPLLGSGFTPAQAHALGQRVGKLASARGGSVMATTSRRTSAEATEALAAGLGRSLHLLYRWGEPGDNPYLGFLAMADAIVVTADSVAMLSEASATLAPVFVALPELAGVRQKRLITGLTRASQVRPLGAELTPWPRASLDEAARVADEIRRRFSID